MRYQVFTRNDVPNLQKLARNELSELSATCSDTISKEYIMSKIATNEQLLVVIVSRNNKHKIIGFCIVSIHQPDDDVPYGFVDLLCSAKESSEVKRKYKSSGSDLLKRAEYELVSRGYTMVSLHAVLAATDFYFRLGYMYTTPEYAKANEEHIVYVDDEQEVIMTKNLDTKPNLFHEFLHKKVRAPPRGADEIPKEGKVTEVWYSPRDETSTTSITYEDGEKEDIPTGGFGTEENMPRFLDLGCNISYLHQRLDHVESYLNI
jgi:predicted N-acetyltransferase YhbS